MKSNEFMCLSAIMTHGMYIKCVHKLNKDDY